MESIIPMFFRMEGFLRLYHWRTRSYARHKASDEAIGHVVESMDRIVETLLGHTSRDTLILPDFQVSYVTSNDTQIVKELQAFTEFLNGWNTFIPSSDILNLRDDLVGHIRQVLYLMTLD